MERLLLVPMGAWRAGRRKLIVHVGLVEMITHVVHEEEQPRGDLIRGRSESRYSLGPYG